jgi:hypothetical protein
MSTKAESFEFFRSEAQMAWSRFLAAEPILPHGLKPLAVRLMILEIVEGTDIKVLDEPLDPDPRECLNQVQRAWAESPTRRTIPVGTILIGVNDFGPADSSMFVSAAVQAVAVITDQDAEKLTDSLSDRAAAIASRVLRALGVIPTGPADFITEI